MRKKRGAKAEAAAVLSRFMFMLGYIPVAPDGGIDAGKMADHLEANDFEVSRRTIERDLVSLSQTMVGLERSEKKPYTYRWRPDAPLFAVPRMSAMQACTLQLVERHLASALPKAAFDSLAPYFAQAGKCLHKDWAMARWTKEKLRVEGIGFHLAPPKIKKEVRDEIYAALFDEHPCRVRYYSPNRREETVHTVHPLGLLLRDSVVTLLCLRDAENEPRQMHLHRMKSAKRLDETRRTLPGFNLTKYDAGGGKGVDSLPDLIALKLLVEKSAPMHLDERQISLDQRITPHDADRMRVEATVPNTREFIAWLRGFGPCVEVLAPKEMRAPFEKEAAQARSIYLTSP